jgi:hypothetical protein
VSRLRWTLVALLAASTVLFAVGVIAERSEADTHAPEAAQTEAAGGDGAETHEQGGETGATESDEGRSEPASGETGPEEERPLGIDLESTPLIVLAVLAGLGLAALAATPVGRLRGFLLAVALIALVWTALDVREVAHQVVESRTGIAVVAIVVAVLHLATALLAGAMAMRARPAGGGSPARPGTIPA